MCPQSGFLWTKVKNFSSARQEVYLLASASKISRGTQFCLFSIFISSRETVSPTDEKLKIFDFAKIMEICTFTNIMAIWTKLKKFYFPLLDIQSHEPKWMWKTDILDSWWHFRGTREHISLGAHLKNFQLWSIKPTFVALVAILAKFQFVCFPENQFEVRNNLEFYQ